MAYTNMTHDIFASQKVRELKERQFVEEVISDATFKCATCPIYFYYVRTFADVFVREGSDVWQIQCTN